MLALLTTLALLLLELLELVVVLPDPAAEGNAEDTACVGTLVPFLPSDAEVEV